MDDRATSKRWYPSIRLDGRVRLSRIPWKFPDDPTYGPLFGETVHAPRNGGSAIKMAHVARDSEIALQGFPLGEQPVMDELTMMNSFPSHSLPPLL